MATDPAPRMVQVPAEALEAALLEIQRWEHARAWCDSDDLNEAEEKLDEAQRALAELLVPGPHEDSPLPALSTPAPQPGEVGTVLGMLAEWISASRIAADPEEPAANHHMARMAEDALRRRLLALDPARLRALARSLPTPQPAEAAGLREGVTVLRDEYLALEAEDWRSGFTRAHYGVAANRLDALLLAHPAAQQQTAEAGEPIPLVKENPDGSVTLNATINVTPGFRFHIEHTHADLEARTLTPLHDGARFGLYRRVAAQPSGDES